MPLGDLVIIFALAAPFAGLIGGWTLLHYKQKEQAKTLKKKLDKDMHTIMCRANLSEIKEHVSKEIALVVQEIRKSNGGS